MTKVDRDQQRAKEPVSDCLIRQLMVPDIYWEAEWPVPGARVDVLAIDRAGSGAVHVVEIKRARVELADAVAQIMSYPAQYRWLVLVGRRPSAATRAALELDRLYPAGGPGRVGVIAVVPLETGDLKADVLVKAERFPGSYRDEVKQFASMHRPDISFD